MRRGGFLLAAVAALALAVVPAAYAREPTITTSITFPEGGEPFGTFTALEPLCPSGTFVDEQLGGGGAFVMGPFYHAFSVLKTFTCDDGSGTFTILFHPQFSPATPASCDEAGPFSVVGGTGLRDLARPRRLLCLSIGRRVHRDVHWYLPVVGDHWPPKAELLDRDVT